MRSVSLNKLFSSLGNAHEFELALIKLGVKPGSIQDVIRGKLAVSFTPAVKTAKKLNFKQLLSWLQKNKLDSKLLGGLNDQIAEQEKFYRRFYRGDFRIECKEIFVDAGRLLAIKAGLENGCLNYALIKARLYGTPMTGAEYAFEYLAKKLKPDGFKIWAETRTDRWTKLTLAELLQRCNPTEPEEFDAAALKNNWPVEVFRVINLKGAPPEDNARSIELVFTSNLADIPGDQIIVNKDGEIVRPDNSSYASAAAKKVRVLSHEEGIILASQLYARNKTYLALNTWEWRRDVVNHGDKNTSPPVSVASASSGDGELGLFSGVADVSSSDYRLRLAL